ncbi:MAG: hypothetical protein ACO3D8_04125, partial [Ilumatobacteraceae bacterium]
SPLRDDAQAIKQTIAITRYIVAGMRRRLLSGNWYGPTNPVTFKSSGSVSRISFGSLEVWGVSFIVDRNSAMRLTSDPPC